MRIKSTYQISEIETDLYTDGTVYETEDGIPYVGIYHKYKTTGELYTEPNWNERYSKRLRVIDRTPVELLVYKKLKPSMILPNIKLDQPIPNVDNINVPKDIN
jgi:hypothetical protein